VNVPHRLGGERLASTASGREQLRVELRQVGGVERVQPSATEARNHVCLHQRAVERCGRRGAFELDADLLGDDVVLDDVGMRAIPAEAARQFFAERAEQTARMDAQSRRLQEKKRTLVQMKLWKSSTAQPSSWPTEIVAAPIG
jgi:hypothetical protein